MPVLDLKPGLRLRSAVSAAEFVVVRSAGAALELQCGGAPLVPADTPVEPADGVAGQSTLGKRYVDAETAVELLCTKGGAGELSVDGRVLTLKGAKTLPSSD
ncbi:MAG: hypothetical protein JWM48_1906 [Mycobacterium sp.]|nr:hypothetical protein [Mycobacterium sp.]MCW2745356.1 hypothetical protein [Mycobacterium sp.]